MNCKFMKKENSLGDRNKTGAGKSGETAELPSCLGAREQKLGLSLFFIAGDGNFVHLF